MDSVVGRDRGAKYSPRGRKNRPIAYDLAGRARHGSVTPDPVDSPGGGSGLCCVETPPSIRAGLKPAPRSQPPLRGCFRPGGSEFVRSSASPRTALSPAGRRSISRRLTIRDGGRARVRNGSRRSRRVAACGLRLFFDRAGATTASLHAGSDQLGPTVPAGLEFRHRHGKAE